MYDNRTGQNKEVSYNTFKINNEVQCDRTEKNKSYNRTEENKEVSSDTFRINNEVPYDRT